MQANNHDPIDEIDVELDDQPEHKVKRRDIRRYGHSGGGKKRWLIAGSVVVVLLVAAGIAVLLLRNASESSEKPDGPAVTQTDESKLQQPKLSATEAAQIETFKSEKLAIELSHRKDWTLKESADKTEITLTSPNISYQTKDGTVSEDEGVFTLRFRQGVSDQLEQKINSAKAVRDSEVIAYAAPTEAQRHYTNVSFAGSDADYFTFLIVTGSTGYKAGGAMAGSLSLNTSTFLIVGGYGVDATGTLNFDAVPKAEIDSTALAQAIDIIESLKIF